MYTDSTIILHLPTQFHLACILYQIPPRQFLQDLISHIILPSDHIDPDKQTLFATDYFLEYAALVSSQERPYTKARQDFLDQKLGRYHRLLQHSGECTPEERVAVMNLFFEQCLTEWYKLP